MCRRAVSTLTPSEKRHDVPRPVDADVLGARLDAERVEQAVVVVGIAVELVDRDVELVGALHQVEAVHREDRFGVAVDPRELELLEAGVGAVAADALGVEDADADRRSRRSPAAPASGSVHVEPVAGLWNTCAAFTVGRRRA